MNNKFILSIIFISFIGCSVTPSGSTFEEAIIKHFEARKYKVLEIIIGNVRTVPQGEEQYMGTEGYIIDVPLITLELMRDSGEPWNYKKGQHITFYNAIIRTKKGADKTNEWMITDISGVPLP